METQIFYWTGVVIWWGICLCVVGGVGTMVVITPLYAFGKSRKGWWRWLTMAKFAEVGWSQDELNHIAAEIGGADDEFLKKAAKALEVARDMKGSGVDRLLRSKQV